jgi:hypothetical protein
MAEGYKPLTVENLTNSLAQIELWIKAIRVALSKLPADTTLSLSTKEASIWKGDYAPLRTTRECPPPE